MKWNDPIHIAFEKQKRDAKYRGIAFLFDEDEWISWWLVNLGPNWVELRGRCKGKYCMSRFGDDGPYAWWNVECITFEENCRRRKLYGTTARGEQQGLTKLTRAKVRQIWFDKRNTVAIEKALGVNRHTVQNIRSGRCWGHFTKTLKANALKKNRRLTANEAVEIFKDPGGSGTIARRFKVKRSIVWMIKHRKIWTTATRGLGKAPFEPWSRK